MGFADVIALRNGEIQPQKTNINDEFRMFVAQSEQPQIQTPAPRGYTPAAEQPQAAAQTLNDEFRVFVAAGQPTGMGGLRVLDSQMPQPYVANVPEQIPGAGPQGLRIDSGATPTGPGQVQYLHNAYEQYSGGARQALDELERANAAAQSEERALTTRGRLDTPERTDWQNKAAEQAYDDVVTGPAGNITITPGVPGPIRAAAGVLYAPKLIKDVSASLSKNGTDANGNPTPGNAVIATGKQFLVDPILDPAKRLIANPGQFASDIYENPTKLWSDVFLPGAMVHGAIKPGIKPVKDAATSALDKRLEESFNQMEPPNFAVDSAGKVDTPRNVDKAAAEPIKTASLDQQWNEAIQKQDLPAMTKIADAYEQQGNRMTAQGIRNYVERQRSGTAAMLEPDSARSSSMQEKVNSFVDNAISQPAKFETLPVRELLPDEAATIRELTNISVDGFKHEISTNELRHALKEHGDAVREAKRGQLPITADDLKKIPDILDSYDSIKRGSDSGNNKSIIYQKRVNGSIYYVETVIPKKGVLRTKTMWKKSSAQIVPDKSGPPYTSESSGLRSTSPERSLTPSTTNISPGESGVKGQQAALPFKQSGVGSPTLDTVTRKQIIDDINKLVVTHTGRIGDRGALGIFKINSEVVRSRKYGDLEVLSHEVGHYLDKKFNLADPAFDGDLIAAADKQWGDNPRYQAYSRADKRAEGVAEFARQYMVDPAAAQKNFPGYYSTFESSLTRNPDVKAAVEGIRDKMQVWLGQSPEARGRGAMSFGYETPKDSIFQRAKDGWYKFYEKLVDDKLGLAKATSDIEKHIGEKLAMEDNPYKQARLAQSSAVARAQLLTESAEPGLVKKTLNKIYGNIIERGVTIKEIIDGIDKKDLSKKYPDYLKNGNFRDWREAFDTYVVARRQLELQRINPKYQGPMSATDARSIVARAPSEFLPLAGKFYRFHDNLMRIALKGGLISEETYNALKTKYKEYAPMMRDFADEAALDKFFGGGRGFGNVGSPLKSLSEEGSARSVVSPLESTIKNTYAVLNMVERNRVAQTFVRLSDRPGIGRLVEEVPGGADSKQSIFTVMIDGKKKAYQTTPEIYRAIMSMNEDTSRIVMKILSVPAGWLRAGATLTPDFILRNLSRDTISAAVYSKHGFLPLADSLRGLAELINNKELYYEYKASGAQMATFVALDRDNVRQTIGKLIKQSVKQKYNPIEWLRAFSEAAETATRLGEFSKARGKGASIAEAGLAAKDVTVDFNRHGSIGKEWNKIAAFFNAAIQGTDRMARAFREDPIGFNRKAIMYVTVPSLALWMLNHDQEWYKEEPEWSKNAFWMFKAGDTIYRIPKPFELGIIYGSAIERGLDYYLSRDPKKVKEWAKAAKDGFLPSFMPTVAAPIVEWATNYSFFRDKNIVPEREQKVPDYMQFGPYTSETAKAIGRTFDLSPRKIDNTIQGYTGSMGKMVLSGIDYLSGKYDNLPTQQIENLPGLRSVMSRPFQNPQSVSDFYDKLDEMEKAYADHGKNRNPPNELRRMRETGQTITDLHKKEREILNSNLSPAEKERKLNEVNDRLLREAKKALGRG